ncbi:isocitrate/isopropylmalate family dehydrogenase [Klebsiella pneumoniae]|nr:isocitrate/isopropylmalate family dehydrogenase [Klebsiella pneumoniae]
MEHLPPAEQQSVARCLTLRKHFKLFSNLRPAKLYQGWKSSARCAPTSLLTADILCVRELTGIWLTSRGREGSGQHESLVSRCITALR